MKRALSILVSLALIFSFSLSFSATPKVVVVHNSKELFKALKSNTTIKLAKGEYSTEVIAKTKYAFYNASYSGCYSVKGATIKNLKNVRIYSDTNALIYTSKDDHGISYDSVLILKNCSNIKFENITFGHKGKDPNTSLACDASVLALDNCKNVEIRNCDLFGCGFVGLCAEKGSSITVKDSKIRDCEASAFWLNKCKKVSFINTEMYQNGADERFYRLGHITDSTDTLLSLCSIHDNGGLSEQSGKIASMFMGNAHDLVMDRCRLENNKY